MAWSELCQPLSAVLRSWDEPDFVMCQHHEHYPLGRLTTVRRCYVMRLSFLTIRCSTSEPAQRRPGQSIYQSSLGHRLNLKYLLRYVDRVCSGRSSCDVSVGSPELHEFRPCPEQLTMYLEATYSCLTGQMLYSSQ